jgi:hypothetical protein
MAYELSHMSDGALVIRTGSIPSGHNGQGDLVFAMGATAEADPLMAAQQKVAQFVIDACNEKLARESRT